MKKKEATGISPTDSKTKTPSCNFTTDLFKNRKDDVPNFITDHHVFRKPMKIGKIFPTIGLKNFKESCELVKPLIDLKKENFVSTLIGAMVRGLADGRDEAVNFGDRIQFILEGADRDAQLAKIDDIYNLSTLCKNLLPQIDTYNNAYERVVQSSEGKIVLRLVEEVCGSNGKPVFRKNESLFKVFAKLREQFAANKLNFFNLEQAQEFKNFCAENIPNKKYQVVFSAEGEEGAWDILTMSMRGIKSCQRWDGDYPRCLIGSIVSKYVGIIYITSGADFEGRGSKMMRRSLVRYAINADEGKPCLLIDRIYPLPAGAAAAQQAQETDEETLKIFMDVLKAKTDLPIHFSPRLGSSVRHFYVPYEKIREEMPERDWTYQDTPLKTNIDFQLHVLSSAANEDMNRYVNCFRAKLITHMGEQFRKILTNDVHVDEEIYRTIRNMQNCAVISADRFNEQISKLVFDRHHFNIPKNIINPRDAYRKYLVQLAMNLRTIRAAQQMQINLQIDSAVSRKVNHQAFTDFLFKRLILDCIKQELKTIN